MNSLRRIETLGRTNKSKLLKAQGFRNINQAIEFYAEGRITKQRKYSDKVKEIAFKLLKNEYNEVVEQLQAENAVAKKVQAKIKREENKKQTFIINLVLKITYRTKFNDPITKQSFSVGEVVIVERQSNPITNLKKNIPEIVKSYNASDSVKDTIVLSYTVSYMNTKALKKNAKPKSKQMMKRGFILKNDWLPYAKSISQNAFEQTDDKCVYYQLEKFLTKPPTGRPTKFIKHIRMGENALFEYFSGLIGDGLETNDYHDFDIQSGVSTEMIAKLCNETKRNMYAYDEDSKCFHCVTNHSSKNYCPIVFYKIHGHFYILDDPFALRSVAESNKSTSKTIITSSIDDKNMEAKILNVFHIDEFPLSQIHELETGVYILQQSNINKETLKYITKYKSVPRTKNNENVIIQIKVKNNLDKDVYVACDTNYGKNIDYNKLKNVATSNSISYVNEGIGSVLHSILNNKSKDIRKYLSTEEKSNVIALFDDKCAACNLKTESYEFDHIIPLGSGGSNDISNIQPLCNDCHKKKTIEENEEGVYFIKDKAESYFNDVVHHNVINTIHFKNYQFVEKVNDEPKEVELVKEIEYEVPCSKNNLANYFEKVDIQKIVKKIIPVVKLNKIFKVDMQKCRRNILLNFKYEFPVYSVMDIPMPFSGEIKCGMYYVNSKNTFPFRGSGWYYQPIVEYGLKNNLIDKESIVLEFIPSKVLPATYFQEPIHTLLEAFETEPALQKLCVNAFVGLMGRTKQVASYSKFTLSAEEAGNWWTDKNTDNDVFIKNHTLDNGEILYEGIFSKEVLAESSKYPIYAMVLQTEAIELHKLETRIKNMGGISLDRNTDAIRYYSNKEIDMSNYYWDDEMTTLKYQKEEASALKVEKLASMMRPNNIDLTKFEMAWNIDYDYNNSAEVVAKEIVESNKSIHIDGRAGTGKTYLANKVIDEIKLKGKKYASFSPTNKGARLIGGNTIHSMYYKYQHNKKKLFDMMKNIEYVFIDEVSMMIEKFYQLFIMLKRTFPSIKFVIVGDFDQLPPVKDSWEGDYKNSSALWSLCDANRIQLTLCRRADATLFNICKDVENIDLNKFEVKEKTFLNLAFTHRTRIRVNHECMERYLLNRSQFIHIKKDVLNPKTQDVKLAIGMPIIAHKTNKKLNILNSEKFTIKSIQKEIILITDNADREIEIKVKDFHYLFYLGFCITIHASQGETFQDKYTIYDWDFKHFCNKAKYVALSRGTNVNNIQIMK